MAISRKPRPAAPTPPVPVSEADVEAVIARGGAPAPEAGGLPSPGKAPAADTRVRVIVQLRADVLAAVERARRENPRTSTRNAWIVETLVHRLEQEGYL